VLRESASLLAYRRLLLDVLLTAASFLFAHQLRSAALPHLVPGLFPGGLYPLRDYVPLLVVVVPLWSALLALQRLGKPGEILSLRREIARELRVVGVGVLVLAAGGYLFRADFISRPFLVLFGVSNAAVLAAARIVERRTAVGKRLMEVPERVVLVVGAGEEAVQLGRAILENAKWGLRLHGLVQTQDVEGGSVGGLAVVGKAASLGDILVREVIDEVVIAVPTRQLGELEDVLLLCQELGVRVRVALRPFPHLQPHVEVEPLDGLSLLTFATMPIAPLSLFIKRIADFAFAGLALVLSSPLLALIAVLVKTTTRGPVLYRQVRSGLRGRPFGLLKFRTMIAGADSMQAEVAHLNIMDGPVFKAPDDPRITRVGRFLRRWSLDELPQFLNVLRGQMSLVGPRPPIPDEVERYAPWQRRRLAMKPGMTCLWQVAGRSELDFATWMELDLAYIDHWSLWLDVKILARTLPAVISGRGAA
jgi:exopolysaccharide biosynthesis polyprenyl glycosylphosphotransferase